jgi:O-antigen/teichoic acid export membrane protein
LLRSNLIANYLGQGWTALMGLAFVPFYVQYLGLEAYGLIGLFAALQAWLTILDLGLTPTLGREMARFTGGEHTPQSIRTLLRSIEAIALVLAASIGLGIWLVSGWIATSWVQTETLDPATVTTAIVLIGAVIALRFLEGLYRSAVVGLERQVVYNLVSAGMATLRAGGAVGVLVWVAPSIIAFFLWQAAISTLTVAVLAGLTYRILPGTGRVAIPSVAALRPVYRFAGGMVGITILSALLMQVDKVLLSRLLQLSEFGAYTLAATAAGALYFLIVPIAQAYSPRLTAQVAEGNTEGFARNYHTAAQLISVIAGSAAIIVFFFSERLVRLWTGDAALATEIAPVLSVLALGNLLNGLMYIPYIAQLAHGWTSLAMKINLVAVVIIIPALLLVVPVYGAFGAAVIWASLNAGYVLIGVRFMHHRILSGHMLAWYRDDVGKPLAVGIGAAVLASALSRNIGAEALADLTFLVLASIAAITSTAAASARMRTTLAGNLYRLKLSML